MRQVVDLGITGLYLTPRLSPGCLLDQDGNLPITVSNPSTSASYAGYFSQKQGVNIFETNPPLNNQLTLIQLLYGQTPLLSVKLPAPYEIANPVNLTLNSAVGWGPYTSRIHFDASRPLTAEDTFFLYAGPSNDPYAGAFYPCDIGNTEKTILPDQCPRRRNL
jgi:hypothetical protein